MSCYKIWKETSSRNINRHLSSFFPWEVNEKQKLSQVHIQHNEETIRSPGSVLEVRTADGAEIRRRLCGGRSRGAVETAQQPTGGTARLGQRRRKSTLE